MPGFRKCERLPSKKRQVARNPCGQRIDGQEGAPITNHSSPNLTLKVPDCRTWAHTDGSCHKQNGNLFETRNWSRRLQLSH
eukprot:scaffold99609_cov18-Tisochrysis_lutea.AAC.2